MSKEINWIVEESKKLEQELIELRHKLHRIPEIGDSLPLTKRVVCEYLNKIGVSYRELGDCDGIVAEVSGASDGKTVAFRADMDGLHIDEQTDVPFKSEIEGQMHACGHDAHTAILLVFAKLLTSHKEHFKGTVKLLFQTGEETGTGAKKMLAGGAIDGAEALFALHVGNLAGDILSCGDFAILPGYVSAGKIKFTITVQGKGTHSAFPDKGIDPILVAARLLLALQDLVANEIEPSAAALISVGSIHAGVDHNTIPETATIRGSIRAQDPAVREYLANRVKELSDEISSKVGATCILDIHRGSVSIKNDEKMAELAAKAVSNAFGNGKVWTVLPKPLMASDDFANYVSHVPSVYFMLHTNNPHKGIVQTNHNPRFDIDEAVLYRGVAAYLAIALEFLKDYE